MKPWQHRQWCIPELSGEFVAAMEDVLALFALPYDARYSTVCLDENPVVLHADVRPPLPPIPRHVERHGTANLFVMVEPLAGWRHVPRVTEHRTKRDYAECLRYLVEERNPDAECICMVQDNLNTHTAGALYEAFPPKQARRILARSEFHFTPKHGSRLNQAEIEISIFERGCLARPVPDTQTLQQRVGALEAERGETSGVRPLNGSSPIGRPASSSRSSTRRSEPQQTEASSEASPACSTGLSLPDAQNLGWQGGAVTDCAGDTPGGAAGNRAS